MWTRLCPHPHPHPHPHLHLHLHLNLSLRMRLSCWYCHPVFVPALCGPVKWPGLLR